MSDVALGANHRRILDLRSSLRTGLLAPTSVLLSKKPSNTVSQRAGHPRLK